MLQEESSKEPSLKAYNDLLGQALASWKTGDFEQALAYVTNAIKAEPDRSKGYDYRSALYHKMGKHDQALADAEEAIRLEPENARYRHSRVVTLRATRRLNWILRMPGIIMTDPLPCRL